MTTRKKYIDFIIEYAGDEIQTKDDALRLAKMTTNDLYCEVVSIIEYYKRVHNKIITIK